MKNLSIATMKEALTMMSIKDTYETEMLKPATISDNGGHFIAKWNGSRVIKAGIAVRSSTRKAGYIAIVEAVIECIGQDRWNEIVEAVETMQETRKAMTTKVDPFESKTKAEIVEKIESIPSEQLSLAVASILYRNPFNEISTNRVIVSKRANHVTRIDFQTNATKQNMITVYREILDQIAISFGIEEMHKIEAGYAPIWWEDDTSEEAEETKEEIEEINKEIAEEAMKEGINWIEEAKEIALSAPSAPSANEETTESETKEEEQKTMKNTKKPMSKIEAIKAIANLDAGMYARIFGNDKYSILDDGICCMITTAASMDEEAFAECKNWHDVLVAVNAHHEKQNYYINGNADFREYHIKYGYDEAVTILQNYIKTVTAEGIADTKTERDYIRGAKDALCIA